MKSISKAAFLLVFFAGLSTQSANAWWWSKPKLDLNSIQGTYNVVPSVGMYLGCPDTITVVYDQANATLDSEAFHFSNIGQGSQSAGQSFDPNQAAYTEQAVNTTVNSNSVTETDTSQTTSSDTSQFPMNPEPLDPQGIPGMPPLAETSHSTSTAVKYDSGSQTLTKTILVDGQDIGQDCLFTKAN
jgi:hypothetical protein